MINKSLTVMIAMYSISMMILVGQYMFADPYGITLTNYKGETIPIPLQNILRIDVFNLAATNIVETNFNGTVNGEPFNKVVDFNQSMAYSVFELGTILSGTYVFHILHFMGVPTLVVLAFTIPYTFLLIRTFVGFLRGF